MLYNEMKKKMSQLIQDQSRKGREEKVKKKHFSMKILHPNLTSFHDKKNVIITNKDWI